MRPPNPNADFKATLGILAMAKTTSRFAARPDDDDDDDDLPRGRRPSKSVDDEDDRPVRKPRVKRSGMSPLLIVALILGSFLLVGCLTVGVIVGFVYSTLPKQDQITISGASRTTIHGLGKAGHGTPQITVNYKCSTQIQRDQVLIVVVECQGQRSKWVFPHGVTPGSTGQLSWSAKELAGTNGPMQVWIEDEVRYRVSNTYLLP